MTIINHISVRGLRNVLDHDIALPEGVEHIVFTGFCGTDKTAILDAAASGGSEAVTMYSKVDYKVIVWNRDDVTGCLENLISHSLSPVVLIVDDAQIGLDSQHQRRFLPDLIERFHNIQILASTDSPFIILNMKRTAVYNLDTRKIHIGPDTMTYDEIGRVAFGV